MRKHFFVKPKKRKFIITACMNWDEYGNAVFDYHDSVEGYITKGEAEILLFKKINSMTSYCPLEYEITEE